MKNITLFEINKGISIERTEEFWIKTAPTLWSYRYTWTNENSVTYTYGYGAWGYGYYGTTGSGFLPAPPKAWISKAGSFTVENTDYTQVYTLADAAANDETFYFDFATQVLYVNFTGGTDPMDYTGLSIGTTKGYSNFPIYYDNLMYESRLINAPAIDQQRDALFFGVVSFEGGTVTLINSDGHFDTLDQEKIFGQPCRILYSSDSGANFELVYTGKYESHSISGDSIVISIKDSRKALLQKPTQNYYNTTTYPNMNQDFIGAPIPQAYGTIKKAPAVHIGAGVWKFVDTSRLAITSIGTVYKNGLVVAPTSSSIANGTVTYSVYNADDTIVVDFVGYNITNPLSIIEDLFDYNLNIAYNSNFYNTTSWGAAKTALTTPVCLYIGAEEKSIIDLVGELSASVFGFLIIDGDGKYNYKLVDNTKSASYNIKRIEFLEQPAPSMRYLSKEYVSSVAIRYLLNTAENIHRIYRNQIYEADLYSNYRVKIEKEFTTNLITDTDAQTFSEKAMDLYGGVFQTWTITTKMQTKDIELEDIITAELYKNGTTIYPVTLEVIGKTIDYINSVVKLVCRAISVDIGVPLGSTMIRR